MTRIHERGSASVVGYIVVGVILAVIVVGGVYVAKHQLAAHFSSPDNGGGSVATVDGDQNASIDTTKDKSSKDQNKSNNTEPQSSENKSSDSKTSDSTAKNSQDNTGNGSRNLPATGSQDVVERAGALAILTGAGVAYLRSRRS